MANETTGETTPTQATPITKATREVVVANDNSAMVTSWLHEGCAVTYPSRFTEMLNFYYEGLATQSELVNFILETSKRLEGMPMPACPNCGYTGEPPTKAVCVGADGRCDHCREDWFVETSAH